MLKQIKNHLQNYALHRTRAQLLNLSDRQLEDVGISRRLLVQGVTSWPWREDEKASTELAAQPAKMKAKDINSAIQELSRMSDKQLRDIGIDRGTIRHSVTHGVDGRGPGRKQAA